MNLELKLKNVLNFIKMKLKSLLFSKISLMKIKNKSINYQQILHNKKSLKNKKKTGNKKSLLLKKNLIKPSKQSMKIKLKKLKISINSNK
jgi:hypothetical protein